MQTTKIDSRRNRKPNRPITSKETESSNQKHFTQKKILYFKHLATAGGIKKTDNQNDIARYKNE